MFKNSGNFAFQACVFVGKDSSNFFRAGQLAFQLVIVLVQVCDNSVLLSNRDNLSAKVYIFYFNFVKMLNEFILIRVSENLCRKVCSDDFSNGTRGHLLGGALFG